ncbi:MAG: flagellar protein FlaG [Betaproteobacteria bacterium]|jgi:flagellar protein FlaG
MPSESITVTPAISTGSQPIETVKRPPETPEASPIPRLESVLRDPTEQPAKVEKSSSEVKEELTKAIADVQIMMELRDRSVNFVLDEESGAEIVRVVDDKSGDVIRQMPTEELLTFMRNLTRMLGTFVNREA